MALDRVGIATNVCEAVSERYTVKSACAASGITNTAFYNWVKEDPTIADLYKTAKELARQVLNDELVKRAETAVEKAINCSTLQTVKSTKSIYKFNDAGEKMLTGVEVTERELPVNPVLLMFVLQNCAADRYGQHAQKVEPTETVHPDSEVYDLTPLPETTA